MNASETVAMARLWTENGFRDDDWKRAEEADVLPGEGKLILALEAFLALDEAAREEALPRLGVEVLPGETVDLLLPFLDRLPLVALAFPAFNDGRSYSKAELLRSRHGYRGELRATGDVLIDQIPHMLRCGFSSFEVMNQTALARLEAGQRGGIPLYYQPTATASRPGKYAWRRLAG
ncbi:DUF934 domain-containing protein [Chelativorans alearense]|uniref:DUF934 domain-containing protein n=1 Tax=Chelativorans alearense TaxID=2681495 RepID=UPI0013D6050F|nr:DUF934 domain-containing protein [Chelativorans alearense]